MEMTSKRTGLLAVGFALAFAGVAAGQSGGSREGYSYLRESSGDVTVDSQWNGRVEASRNMPITVGDGIDVSSGGRAEVALADGNVLYIGGGSRAKFSSLADQQGEDDAFSMVRLEEGSVILAAFGSDRGLPRVDTEDATVYLAAGGQARVNYDPNRGTVVIGRAGTTEVRTREGSYRVRAGEYLMVRGDEEPEIEHGDFSRDRFDIWASDRHESGYETPSTSARYVDEDYSSDVAGLDGYGDWDYSDTASSYVFRPRVGAGWSPYSNGSWYYTPAGLTWWSSDPWGWYPSHYGNWFFDASWSSWCWSPAYVYSPAWVYWCYTPSFVGWCPVGWYGYYSPWASNYYRQWGFHGRGGGMYLAINGRFPARGVDFRGWNFAGANGIGGAGRLDVTPGARMGNRLGDSVAVSSRPIVVTARPGQGREAVQSFVREAPRTVVRAGADDSSRFAPVLARDRTLPAETVQAMRDRTVVAERGRLVGPAAADIAPRGARIDTTRTLEARGRDAGNRPAGGFATDNAPGRTDSGTPGRSMGGARPIEPRTVIRGDQSGVEARPADRNAPAAPAADWRRSPRARDVRPVERPESTMDSRANDPRRSPSRSDVEWRSRPRAIEAPDRSLTERAAPDARRPSESWRSHSSVPPARRVIEGAVPGRRDFDNDGARRFEPRDGGPAPSRDFRADPRGSRPEMAPAPRSAAPPPRVEPRSAPAPAPRAEFRSAPAPAPRSAPAPPPPRPAPAPPHHGRH